MDRPTLRRQFRRARCALSVAERRRHSLSVARHFLCSPLALRNRIAAYLAIDGEPVLEPLLARLALMGKQLALPIIERDGGMGFFTYRPSAPLVVNRHGIREPAPGAPFVATLSLSVVLAPLVAFDDDGNRLGMGGGFYDRHFAALPKKLRPVLVGVAHGIQRAPTLPSAPWDIPLDAVLTEAGLQVFSKRAVQSPVKAAPPTADEPMPQSQRYGNS